MSRFRRILPLAPQRFAGAILRGLYLFIQTPKNGVLNADNGGGKNMRPYRRTVNKPRRVITSIDELPVICDCAEAGLLFKMTPERINKMARDGILPAVKIGNAWKFRRDDLVAYLDKLFAGEATL